MQEYFILLGVGLSIFLVFLFGKTKKWGYLAVCSTIFLALGVGIFSSGLERLEGRFLIDDSATPTIITPQATTYLANFDNPVVMLAGFLFLILFFVLMGEALEERNKDAVANDMGSD